ncbi:MAG: RloB family protein, partial [Gelidibacter sp.]
MARTIKIDNALQKRFSKKQGKRKKSRDLVTYFLIVCEGEKTEPNYFKSFPKQVGKVIYDIEFDGGGISTLKVVEKAIELREKSKQKYDRVWAVFDRDSFKASSFNSAVLKAKAHNIECAWSNEAFELWYLFHFHNRITAMTRGEYRKAIEDAVNEKLGKKKKAFQYKKNDTSMYSLLNKLGSQEL